MSEDVLLIDHRQDWRDECSSLFSLVKSLELSDWDRQTPSEPWTIRHQIGHLLWTDQMFLTAMNDPETFNTISKEIKHDASEAINLSAYGADSKSSLSLLQEWEDCLDRLYESVSSRDLLEKMPWFGPSMRIRTSLSARIMEMFAHGQDIRDAIGIDPPSSARLWHIADLAIRTRRFSFQINGLPEPDDEVRVELEFEGQSWSWGPEKATERVHGPAQDFALLACQRRNRQDLQIRTEGPDAERWMLVIQAFAGPPGSGRPPLDQRTECGGSSRFRVR